MGAKLSGLLLEEQVRPEGHIVFTRGLAYGSWYDIQVVTSDDVHHLKRSVYLSYGKTIGLSEILACRDYGPEWNCNACEKKNQGSAKICRFCHKNQALKVLSLFACAPVVGVPFGAAQAVLEWGTVAWEPNLSNCLSALTSTAFTVLGVATTPFTLASVAAIPSRVVAKKGLEFSARAVLVDCGPKILRAVGSQLVKSTATLHSAKTTVSGVLSGGKKLNKLKLLRHLGLSEKSKKSKKKSNKSMKSKQNKSE